MSQQKVELPKYFSKEELEKYPDLYQEAQRIALWGTAIAVILLGFSLWYQNVSPPPPKTHELTTILTAVCPVTKGNLASLRWVEEGTQPDLTQITVGGGKEEASFIGRDLQPQIDPRRGTVTISAPFGSVFMGETVQTADGNRLGYTHTFSPVEVSTGPESSIGVCYPAVLQPIQVRIPVRPVSPADLPLAQ